VAPVPKPKIRTLRFDATGDVIWMLIDVPIGTDAQLQKMVCDSVDIELQYQRLRATKRVAFLLFHPFTETGREVAVGNYISLRDLLFPLTPT
jgi:hypothetical protein